MAPEIRLFVKRDKTVVEAEPIAMRSPRILAAHIVRKSS